MIGNRRDASVTATTNRRPRVRDRALPLRRLAAYGDRKMVSKPGAEYSETGSRIAPVAGASSLCTGTHSKRLSALSASGRQMVAGEAITHRFSGGLVEICRLVAPVQLAVYISLYHFHPGSCEPSKRKSAISYCEGPAIRGRRDAERRVDSHHADPTVAGSFSAGASLRQPRRVFVFPV